MGRLFDARIDVAIRVGRLADSGWIARPLGEFEMILCASPQYIEQHGVPDPPHDLANHRWLAFARDTVEVAQLNTGTSNALLPFMTLERNSFNYCKVPIQF